MSEEHAGHRRRMRQKYLEQGLAGFQPHEVLELILFYAIPQRNVNPLAHRLIRHFGSLHAVLEASVEDLQAVEGMGEYAATLLSLFAPVARKLSASREGERAKLANLGDVKRHCLHLLDGLKLERFYVVCLDAQARVIRDALIASGTTDEVQVYPRIVAQTVLQSNAHSVVLCHNHPGGNEVPSQADVDMTQELITMLSSMGVPVADHIVVADGRALSMSQYGLILHERSAGGIVTRVAEGHGKVHPRARQDAQAMEYTEDMGAE